MVKGSIPGAGIFQPADAGQLAQPLSVASHDMTLTIGVSPMRYIDVTGYDLCSLTFSVLKNTSFDSGVITIRKANIINGPTTNFSPVKTVSAAGYVELTSSDWQKARYIVPVVTTSSSASAVVAVEYVLKKNDSPPPDALELLPVDLLIPAGKISGYSSVNKFGRSTAITTGNTWEIWDGNSAYTWPTSASITHVRAAVDSANLLGLSIEVQGLDTNWDLVTQSATLDGTDASTEVALTTALRRCFRMKVTDDVVTDQNIWAGPTGFATKQAIITAGNNQTLMAIYTVPADHTAYVTNYYATANPGGGAPTTFNVSMWAQDNANSYKPQLKHIQGVSADVDAYGRMQHFFSPYYKFSEKTDIILKGSPTGASVDVSAGFDLILETN